MKIRKTLLLFLAGVLFLISFSALPSAQQELAEAANPLSGKAASVFFSDADPSVPIELVRESRGMHTEELVRREKRKAEDAKSFPEGCIPLEENVFRTSSPAVLYKAGLFSNTEIRSRTSILLFEEHQDGSKI